MAFSGTKSLESEQTLYLKRLLVTLKQQFESKLSALNKQLQEELSKNHLLTQELESFKGQLSEVTTHHEEEVKSLKEQLLALRELVKTSKTEAGIQSTPKKFVQLNEQGNADQQFLNEDIEKKQNQIADLEAALEKERAEHRLEVELLTEKLAFYKSQDDQHELITSNTSSYQLRQEFEFIKQTLLQGAQEAKTFEIRYADLFKDKMTLEHHLKVLNEEFENQSSLQRNLKIQLEELLQQNQALQSTLTEKEACLLKEIKIQHELSDRVERLDLKCLELTPIQEKYEQLKDEYILVNKQLEEMLDLRAYAEKQLEQTQLFVQEQEALLADKSLEIESLLQERQHLLDDIEKLHQIFTDSETNLKTAQQHLAKKVKESALLVEKVEEHQNDLTHYMQMVENDKSQISLLQIELENSQKQEKKLQDQLHESLKSIENQVAKWEKKYFEMYDKWQVSENQIRELKKLEEKHLQMQNLLSNLGNYMGPSFSPSQLFQAMTSASNSEGKSPDFLFPAIQSEDSFKEHAVKKEETLENAHFSASISQNFNDE